LETNNTPSKVALLENKVGQQEIAQQASDITVEQLALGKRLLNWRTIIPLAIVFVALFIFAQKAHINVQQTWAAVSHANLLYFVAAFGIYYLSFALRAARWQLLLENAGFTKANGAPLPKFAKLVEIIYISFFANAIVPAKLGDLYRAYLLRKEVGGATTARSFGTVVAERLLDLIVLLLLFIPAILVSLHKKLPSQLLLSLELLLAAVVVGVAVLFVLGLARDRIAQLIPPRFREHYYHFHAGTLGSLRRLPILTVQTVAVWLCEALRFFFVALSLNLIPGSLLHGLAASTFIGLGVALLTIVPATGGGIGLVEGGIVAMLALFSQGPNTANLTAAAIILERSITLFSVLAFGLPIFLLTFGRKAAKQAG